MDQSTFTSLSGITLDASQSLRYARVKELAERNLEGMLGWPLDPESWDNQYIEIGKVRDDYAFCSDVAIDEELEAPDEVVGKYRLYGYHESDLFLAIDPAIEIHAVKLVRDGVTYRTFAENEYDAQWVNGRPRFTKFLGLNKCRWCGYWCWIRKPYQLAVDATWAFADETVDDEQSPTLPIELQSVLADMLVDSFDDKANIKSESVISHSYTKFDKSPLLETHNSILQKYAGPYGSVKRRLV